MKKTLVVGSNVMDMITTTKVFPLESQTVLGDTFKTAPGGKGANQAYQIGQLQMPVKFVGKVGNDAFGSEILESLKEADVDVSAMQRSDKSLTAVGNVMLEQKEDGGYQNRIIVVPGANMDLEEEDLQFLQTEIKEFDQVVLQFEIPMSVNLQVCRWAHDAGTKVHVNPAPADKIPDQMIPLIDFLYPNETELQEISGIPLYDEQGGIVMDQVKKAADLMLARGVKNLVVTLGGQGVYFCNQNEAMHVPCCPVKRVVDPTAAGDSFIGSFVSGLAKDYSIEKSLRFANLVASMTVQGQGAQPSLANLDQVFDYARETGIEFEF